MLRRHWKSTLAALLVIAALAFNLAAYQHAWHMTHYVDSGLRTASPESLTWDEKLRTLVFGVRIPRPTNDTDPDALGLPYETLRFAAADGVWLEAWYVPAPRDSSERRPPLAVLFHGYASAKESLLDEARAYRELGLDTMLVDFRGSGGSAGAHTTIGWDEAHDVAAAASFARERYGPSHLLLHGNSLGAVAVLRACHALEVDADALVLEAPFASLLDTTVRRFARTGVPSFPAAQLLVFWGGVQLGFDGFRVRPRDWIGDLTSPALFLFGTEDPNILPEEAEAMLAAAPAAVEHRIVNGAGHPPLVHGHRATWLREVRGFLERAGVR